VPAERRRLWARCVHPPPARKHSQILFILFTYLVPQPELSKVGWSLCGLILSDGFALSSLLLQNENLGQPKAETHLSVFYNHLLHKWVRLWKPPSGVLWMKEGEKNIFINMIQMQKNWMFSAKRLRRSRHFFIQLMNLYESPNVVIAALWFG